ncbi:MAG: hypothetical protein MSIBF_01880 [Candidatus Altiarchaeales archaeon IMC4]|nr:MAG: hypothetical protein MSIBF_01880 [Candidatus Altiarchaeales archaeon IMC4]
MIAKRKKAVEKTTSKKAEKTAKIRQELRAINRKLTAIAREVSKSTESKVVDEDLRRIEDKVKIMRNGAEENDILFYRNFILRCMKCEKEFEHTAEVRASRGQVECPECLKRHEIFIKPVSKRYSVDAKHLEVVK